MLSKDFQCNTLTIKFNKNFFLITISYNEKKRKENLKMIAKWIFFLFSFYKTALIFRGLDALTTEEGLVTALNQALPSSLAPIKNIAIIRDNLNTSRGFGFVEFHTVTASTQMLDALNHGDPLEVDGKQLIINYAKNTYNTT